MLSDSGGQNRRVMERAQKFILLVEKSHDIPGEESDLCGSLDEKSILDFDRLSLTVHSALMLDHQRSMNSHQAMEGHSKFPSLPNHCPDPPKPFVPLFWNARELAFPSRVYGPAKRA